MALFSFLDFGLSKESEYDQKTYSFCGTVEYMAPEVILFLLMNLALHLNVVCVFRECISVVFDPSQNIIMETCSLCGTKVKSAYAD